MAKYSDKKSDLDREDYDLKDGLNLVKRRHEKFFLRTLKVLPESCASLESVRMTIVFFCVSGLDVLGSLETALTPEERQNIIDWIYSVQVPKSDDPARFRHGFRGGTFFNTTAAEAGGLEHADGGHLAMTGTALNSLVILGDDLRPCGQNVHHGGVAEATAAGR